MQISTRVMAILLLSLEFHDIKLQCRHSVDDVRRSQKT